MSICKEINNTTFIWNFIFEIYRICIKIKRMSKGKKKKRNWKWCREKNNSRRSFPRLNWLFSRPQPRQFDISRSEEDRFFQISRGVVTIKITKRRNRGKINKRNYCEGSLLEIGLVVKVPSCRIHCLFPPKFDD